MIRIAICGIRGRMGSALMRIARDDDDIQVIGGIGRAHGTGQVTGDNSPDVPVMTVHDAGDMLRACDVVIDFSNAAATDELIERHDDVLAQRGLVIGTTGLDPATFDRIDALSSRAAVLTAANFSPGVNLLLALTKRVAGVLDERAFDIEIIEAHHRGKADAPSGTALALGEAAAKGRDADLEQVRRDGRGSGAGRRAPGEIAFHSVRAGGIVGEHRVLFAGEHEVLELRHAALDRAVFAAGALGAAHWIAGREPGRYTMQDVLGL